MYYIQSVISYFVGLAVTHIALYFMNTAQPALLYIVPCLLISTIVTGLFRRELKELYTGKRIKAVLDHKTPSNTSSDSPRSPPVIDRRRPSIIPITIHEAPGDEHY